LNSRTLTLALIVGSLLTGQLGAQTLIVGNKSDDTVDLIDLASGQSTGTVATGHAPHEVAVSPDGKTAVVTNYGSRGQAGSSLTVVDLEAARSVRTLETGRHTRPHGVEFLDDRTVAVTTEGSRHLLLIDTSSGELLKEIETDQEVSHMVAVTPDGRRAFVANIGSGTVTAIDLDDGKKLADIETGAGAEGVAMTPDGRSIWVTNRAADTLSIVNTETLEIQATIACPSFPIRVEITPDGERALVSTARSGEVVVFDTTARRELVRRKLDLENAPDADDRLFSDRFGDSPVPVGIQLSPDGATAWVAATQADAVVEIRTSDLEVLRVLRAGHEPDGMAYSPVAPSGASD
jgi:YVTN family beta-propeller protein